VLRTASEARGGAFRVCCVAGGRQQLSQPLSGERTRLAELPPLAQAMEGATSRWLGRWSGVEVIGGALIREEGRAFVIDSVARIGCCDSATLFDSRGTRDKLAMTPLAGWGEPLHVA
jgi:hypothetical protein